MNITDFARAHGLRVVGGRQAIKKAILLDGRPKPDTKHVPGKRGWITEAGPSMDACVFTKCASALIARAKTLGVVLAAHGDREIAFYFDPTDPLQAEFAIRAIKARRKRRVRVTPELLTRLKATREARRMAVLA